MVYMGGKAKYSDDIVPILQKVIDDNNITEYYEPMCGGCNIIDKIRCEHRYAYDRSDTLIALLKQAQENMDEVLTDGSRELWDKGKAYVKDGIMPEDMSLADIGAMEFFASFSNRGFPGGMAKNTSTRNYFQEARRNLAAQAPHFKGIEFGCQNYWELDTPKGALCYLDPPYANAKTYGYANMPKMDYDHFWQWVRDISVDNYVFVSEQTAPDDFEIVWEKEVARTVGSDNNYRAIERLYKWKEGLA